MSRFMVREGQLWHGDEALGPSTALYADSTELLDMHEEDGVVHRQMPHRIDAVFCAGEKVVGVELKRGSDLMASWSKRRLARQMRTLIREVDVPVLIAQDIPHFLGHWPDALALDLTRLQMLGVIVILTPTTLSASMFAGLKRIVGGERNVLAAIAGRDAPRKNRGPGWFLQGVRGVGPRRAEQLHRRYGTTLAALEQWEDWPVPQGVKEKVKEALT